MSSIKSQAPHHDYGLDQVIRGGKWREEVWDRIARLSDAVGQLPDGTGRQTELHTAEAFKLAGQSWSEWFARHGSHIEATWRQLRLAEESLVREVPPQQVRSQAILAREKGLRYLGRDDSLVLALDEKLADPGQSTEATESLRGLASAVLSEAHRVSDDRHRRLRALSGQLWLVAIGLAVLAIAVVIIVDTSDVNLLPKPKDASWNPAAAAMSAGFIGALFSAIPSLSSAPPRGSTFNPIRAQAALKVSIGAWSGLLGMVAVKAGMASSETETTTLAGFLMVAAVFGAAQEALTRFADRRADTLDGAAPPTGQTSG